MLNEIASRCQNLSWTLLSLLAFGGTVQGQDATIPESERQALIALYESTDGPNWTRQSNWLGPSGSEAQWFGVTIEDGHVVRLRLWANGVDGILPPQIGDLGELRELSFCSNPCSCLERIVLPATGGVQPRCSPAAPFNFIDGPLPQQISNLSKLEVLDLEETQIGGELPAFVGDLPSLKELRLGGNSFTGGIPEEWGQLTQMRFLDLWGSRLSGPLPSLVGNWAELEFLRLFNNQLEGEIPVELANLPLLNTLALSGNRLSGTIHTQLGEMPSLSFLGLSRNALTGTVPPELISIRSLHLDYNALQIDPADREAFGELASSIELTQTRPPGNLLAEQVGGRSQIRLRWDPIEYTDGPGTYRISMSMSPAGPFEVIAQTESKGTASAILTGLPVGQEHYFRLQTGTDPNPFNDNGLLSDPTPTVAATLSDPPPPAQLLLPSLQASADRQTGIALTNLSAQPAEVQLTAFGAEGLPLSLDSNPALVNLPPGNHLGSLVNEIFGAVAAGQIGWVEAQSANPDLAALFLLGNLERLDGTTAIVEQSRRLFFSEILDGQQAWQGGPAQTLLQIVNPNDEPVEVQLQFSPEDEQSLDGPLIAQVEIAPRGFLSQSAGELFQADLSGISGRVEAEVVQGPGAVGFELVEIGSGAALAGLPAVGQASSNSLYAAQVVSGAGFATRLTLGRLHSRNSFAFVSLIQDGRPPLRKSVRLQVTRSIDIGELFELDPQVLTVASLFVETNAPFIGDVLIVQGAPTRSAVAFPLQQGAFREAVFGQIASNPEVYSGFALFNPGTEASQVTLQAFSSAGRLLGEKELLLGPQRRTAQLLRELLAEQGQLGGYLRMQASSPIVADEIIGDFRGEFMSAVLPVVIDPDS